MPLTRFVQSLKATRIAVTMQRFMLGFMIRILCYSYANASIISGLFAPSNNPPTHTHKAQWTHYIMCDVKQGKQ